MKTLKQIRNGSVGIQEAKEFNPKKELNSIKKIDRLLESAFKDMNKLQYGRSAYMMSVSDGIVMARRALNTYELMVSGGDLDGPLQR